MRNEVSGKMALKTQKCDSVQGTFTALFGLEKSRHLVEVEVEQRPFKFKGYISTEAHSNKQLQYIYINRRIVLKSRIHKVVSRILQKRSIICRRKGVGKQIVGRDYSPNSSPPKQPERHGVYMLNLECPLYEYDITFDPRKTLVEFKDWTGVLKLLKDLVYNFLRHNNLLAQEDNYKENNDRFTFADPVLQEVLDDDSQESQTVEKDTNPCTSDLVISFENTVGNLQSKTIRRQNCTKASSADSSGSHVEEVQDTDNVTPLNSVVTNADLSSEEHTLGTDYCEETPESDVPGAQLVAANRRTVKPPKAKEGGSTNDFRKQATGQSDLNSKKDDQIKFLDPPSLNTMLATASCEKESQQASKPRIVKVLMTKIPRTEFPNGPPTLTRTI